MKILLLSGSSSASSTNTKLLLAIAKMHPNLQFQHHDLALPLFQTDKDHSPHPESVIHFKQAVTTAEALIISTPEYIYNMPAILKNALEWLTSSGELLAKPVLVITYMPNPPRGAKAMQSLLWSLQALDARVVGQLPLYQTEIKIENGVLVGEQEILEVVREAIRLLYEPH